MHPLYCLTKVGLGCCTDSSVPTVWGIHVTSIPSLFVTFSRRVQAPEALEMEEGLGLLGDQLKVNKTYFRLHLFERPWLGSPGQSSSATTVPL